MFSFIKSSKFSSLQRSFTQAGLEFFPEEQSPTSTEWWFTEPALFQKEDQETVRYLAQLEEEELAEFQGSRLLITWEHVYRILDDETHQSSVGLLKLSKICGYVPCLSSWSGLSDADFQINLVGWRNASGQEIRGVRLTGAIFENSSNPSDTFLLSGSAWRLVKAVKKLAELLPAEKTQARHQQEWGHIRKLALSAGARLDDFLEKTIILTPESLHLKMNPVFVANTQVVEVQPTFEEAPANWLQTFDQYNGVQDRYSITTPSSGIIHVVIAPAVKTVLSEIKRMPARRVSGLRAQAFVRNPYALLGEDAIQVIPPEVFEADRQAAQLEFYRFQHQVCHENEAMLGVDIRIESISSETTPSEKFFLDSPKRLRQFVDELESKLAKNMLCCFWEGYELELDNNSELQLSQLKATLECWNTVPVETQPINSPENAFQETLHTEIRQETVFDLSNYSERVEGIGKRQTIYSPFISKTSGEKDWIPTEVPVVIPWQAEGKETIYLQCSDKDIEALEQRITDAQQKGETQIVFPNLPQPLSVPEAIKLRSQIRDVLLVKQSEEAKTISEKESVKILPKERLVLQIKQNIEEREYEEKRVQMLKFDKDTPPQLPSSLQPGVQLKDHQKVGVAWLQHLWSKSPDQVRGCLLADDMGLGKTLQMLTFIAHFFEKEPQRDPVLIVAPVALLDNWENEMKRFFVPAFARVLKLYGDSLSALKLPKSQIEETLLEKGLTKFLKPNWQQNADIVLTTYETLRDHEFSLAAVTWSIMVCDEAQKVKTPGALVTQGVKKQNARFKIACTGTPVENSLTDLWCLFDFIQPCFLGELNEFGSRYTRPIESQTEEQKNKLEELRALIEPQIMRRMKTEVAKDLPPKIDNPDPAGLELSLSVKQQQMYQQVRQEYHQKIEDLKKNDKNAGNQLLGFIHRLRMICAHPIEEGANLKLDEILKHSPKLNWMLQQLKRIESKAEKVIIFTDYKELQRVIQKAIQEKFGFSPVIINGETPTSSKGRSRQILIDRFQDKANFGVLILGTSAMGFGVNIQAANHVIHFTRPWNPAKEDQATDRAYRIGQTKQVYVYTPTVVSKDIVTFESILTRLLDNKRKLAQDMLNGCDSIQSEDFMDCLVDGTLTQNETEAINEEHPAYIRQIKPPSEWVNNERQKLTQKLRYHILKRDQSRCVVCGKSSVTDKVVLEIDHIIPISKWGKTEPRNLRAVCRECNRGKGAHL
ncbi:SNF2-related protein [Deltaproteobacteria bacterium TL4]